MNSAGRCWAGGAPPAPEPAPVWRPRCAAQRGALKNNSRQARHGKTRAGYSPPSSVVLSNPATSTECLPRSVIRPESVESGSTIYATPVHSCDETRLKCSRSGVRDSFHKCSRNPGHRLGAAVCLADGSVIVDECASGDHEEARSRVRESVEKVRGVMLDQLVATTGWSRANARRALRAAAKRKGSSRAVKRSREAQHTGMTR